MTARAEAQPRITRKDANPQGVSVKEQASGSPIVLTMGEPSASLSTRVGGTTSTENGGVRGVVSIDKTAINKEVKGKVTIDKTVLSEVTEVASLEKPGKEKNGEKMTVQHVDIISLSTGNKEPRSGPWGASRASSGRPCCD